MADTQLDRLYFTADIDLGPYNAKMSQLGETAKTSGSAVSEHLGKASAGAERLGRGVELSRRELLYLGRELATGDWTRAVQTLTLVASHLQGLSTMGILRGGAIAAPFIAMGVAAVQAELAIQRVNVAIARTGNYSGTNASQIFATAQRIGNGSTPGLSIRGSLDAQSILAGSGNVPGSLLGQGAQAAYAWSKLTGQKEDKASDDLAKMIQDPGKAAKDLETSFFHLSDAEAQRIMAMKSRDEQESAIFADIIKRGLGVQSSMWALSNAFDSAAGFISNIWLHTGLLITGNLTPQQQLDRLNTQLKLTPDTAWNSASRAEMSKEAGDLHWQIRTKNENDARTAKGNSATEDAYNNKYSAGARQLQEYRDEIATAGMSTRDQEMARARANAQRQFTENTSRDADPSVRGRAGAIRDAEIAAAQAEQNQKRREALTIAKDQAAGEMNVAQAYKTSAAAGEDADAVLKAHLEYLKGSIDNEKAYAQALLTSAQAERIKATAQEVTKEKNDLALANLGLSMSGGGSLQSRIAQQTLARRQALGQQGYSGIRLDTQMSLVETPTITGTETAKQQTANADKIKSLQNETALSRLNLSLQGQDSDYREKKLAELKAEQEFILENGSANADQLQQIRDQVDAQQDLNKAIKDTGIAQQQALSIGKDGVGIVGTMLDHINEGAKGLRSLLPDLEQQMLKLVEQLAILNPMENAMTGATTGTAGTLPSIGGLGGMLGGLFGGSGGSSQYSFGNQASLFAQNPATSASGAGSFLGGAFDSAASWIGSMFAKGGAWGSSGLRYAASGMVLDGPTMFGTGDGPVIGGEAGDEALMPLTRGPGGVLGIRNMGKGANGAIHIHQQLNVHPDVSAIARGEIVKAMPQIRAASVAGVHAAVQRGFNPGGRTQ